MMNSLKDSAKQVSEGAKLYNDILSDMFAYWVVKVKNKHSLRDSELHSLPFHYFDLP